ncbi:MAG TPA: hypothetical protein VMV90_15555 [Rectinemataceae bacterium]|nr:hypothetical protein [Rectinemataceae bacterium]
MPGAYASSLIVKAGGLGPQAATYIRLILEDGGNLAIRRAQACLTLLMDRRDSSGFSHIVGHAIAHRVFSPARLKVLFEDEARQNTIIFPISPRGTAMGRDAGYYVRS